MVYGRGKRKIGKKEKRKNDYVNFNESYFMEILCIHNYRIYERKVQRGKVH